MEQNRDINDELLQAYDIDNLPLIENLEAIKAA